MASSLPKVVIHASPLSPIVSTSVSVLKIDCPIGFEVIVDLPLQNESNKLVAFKVKTNRKERYMVQPPRGVLKPGELKQVHIVLIPQDECPDSSKDKFLVQSVALDSPEDVEAAATAEAWWKPYEQLHNPKASQYTFSQFVVPAQLVPTGSRPGGSAFSSPVGTSPLRAPPGQQPPSALSSSQPQQSVLLGQQQADVPPAEGSAAGSGVSHEAEPTPEKTAAAASVPPSQARAGGGERPARRLTDPEAILTPSASTGLPVGAGGGAADSSAANSAPANASPAPAEAPPSRGVTADDELIADLRRQISDAAELLEKEKRRAEQELSRVRGSVDELRLRRDELAAKNEELTKEQEKLTARVASLQRVGSTGDPGDSARPGMKAASAAATASATNLPEQPGISVRTILVVVLGVLIALIMLLWKG